jgi:hypothetical protein
MSDDAPKIIVDDDWKSQAQAEKQKLAEQARAAKAEAASPSTASSGTGDPDAGGGRQLPPASFEALISTMTTQALFAMGAIPDPATGQHIAHLDLARHHIDMLGVLQEKTEGNLSKDESDMLATTIYELRNRYVQLTMSQRPTA